MSESASVPSTDESNGDQTLRTKPKIGIIYPPFEIRNIVDKTALFVSRNGTEFETRIRQQEMDSNRFSFLNPVDPYHGYYRHKLAECMSSGAVVVVGGVAAPVVVQKIPDKVQEQVRKSVYFADPPLPPPELEFALDPPSISQFDLETVKLTAQFVARNGRQFLIGLMNREQRNSQFDFLRPQHSLFAYFTSLIEHYTKIILYRKDVICGLERDLDEPGRILESLEGRVSWVLYQERERSRIEKAAEKERMAYARIDWHDFVIVETVDYHPEEVGDFPVPTTPAEVGARLIEEERQQTMRNVATAAALNQTSTRNEVAAAEIAASVAAPEVKVQSCPPSVPAAASKPPQVGGGDVVIVKQYDPKLKQPAASSAPSFLISPITGEKISPDKLAEHMRYATLDPRWAQVKEREVKEKMEQEDVYAECGHVQSELKKLAERRTDIFGEGDQETIIGKKFGEEDTRVFDDDNRPIWDGHSATIEKTTKKAMMNAEEQLKARKDEHHKPGSQNTANILELRAPPLPPEPPRPPPSPPAKRTFPPQIENSLKSFRINDNEQHLIAEKEFAVRYGGDDAFIAFNIRIPISNDPKHSDYKIQGQIMTVSLAMMDKVSSLKAKVLNETGLPASKQKLQYQNMFMKDANTIAYYNVVPDAIIVLSIKERGGRKK